MKYAIVAPLLFFLIVGSYQVQGQTFDISSSNLGIKVMKDESTAASALAHNHAIKAVGWTGTFTYNEKRGSCAVDISIPVDQLEPDAPETRQWMGMSDEEGPSEDQRDGVKKSMLGKYQLDAANHPTITFKANTCEKNDLSLVVKGDLTIHGVTQAISFGVQDFEATDQLSGYGNFHINATDYGFEPYSAMFGSIKNNNDMTIVFELDGQKQ